MIARTTQRLILAVLLVTAGVAPVSAAASPSRIIAGLRDLSQRVEESLAAGQYEKAKGVAGEMVQYAEKHRLGPALEAQCHEKVAVCCRLLRQYDEARRRLEEAEVLWGKAPKDEKTAFCLPRNRDRQAVLYTLMGRYEDAEERFEKALAFWEHARQPHEHFHAGEHFYQRSGLHQRLGHLDKTRQYLLRASKFYRMHYSDPKLLEPERSKFKAGLAKSYQAMVEAYRLSGRYGDAVRYATPALEIRKKVFGDHVLTVNSKLALAELRRCQGRLNEAEAGFEDARKTCNKLRDSEAVRLCRARCLAGTALTYYDLWQQGKRKNGQHAAQAEEYYRGALDIFEKEPLSDHPDRADCLNNLGRLYHEQGRYSAPGKGAPYFDRAADHYLQALEILAKNAAGNRHGVADTRVNLGQLYYHRQDFADAQEHVSKALGILDDDPLAPLEYTYKSHSLAAQIAWEANRHQQAIDHLRTAMDLALRQRSFGSGAGHHRARFFSQMGGVFERMVQWQAELGQEGDMGEALAAIERSRARSLLDQMQVGGKDLLAGLPPKQARELRRNVDRARTRIAGLDRQKLLVQGEKWKELDAQQRQAKQEHDTAYAALCNASPAMRLAVRRNRPSIALKDLSKAVDDRGALLLEYFLGSEGGYVLIIAGNGRPRLERLAVSEKQAGILGVEPGPLTADRLRNALSKRKGTAADQHAWGVVELLGNVRGAKDPGKEAEKATAALAALWELLIPQTERTGIVQGKFQRLIVVPDGALAWLPLETLVVSQGSDVKYLLDIGPPIEYAPSATIHCNLAGRLGDEIEPVLTVGGVDYSKVDGFDSLRSAQRETDWVVSHCNGGKSGRLPLGHNKLLVNRLGGEGATEAAVRGAVSGQRIVHLACHGYADNRQGNLSGALVLAPGGDGSPADNTRLTLAEIYELDLKSCELAILSACQTNFGPEQAGEGVWAISRGFLVAGARRVAASNWSVDSDATANLVSYFFGCIVQDHTSGQPIDYAKCLREARLSIRTDEENKEWKSPYYWGAFVLVGPSFRAK